MRRRSAGPWSPVKQSPAKRQQLGSPAKRATARHIAADQASSTSGQQGTDLVAEQQLGVGRLHLIMGPMFAGKTTTLLQRVAEAERSHQRVAIITSALDTRYGERQCITHTGVARAALPAKALMPLLRPGGWDIGCYDVIAIDESQFFPDLKSFCLHAVEACGKTVIVAGLSGDFERKTFGDVVALVPFADRVDFLSARCSFCERPAAFTLRLVASDAQALVGGKDAYQPVCRSHYKALSNVRSDFVP